MQSNEYDVVVIKVVDGDTVDVDIDLGFGVFVAEFFVSDPRVKLF